MCSSFITWIWIGNKDTKTQIGPYSLLSKDDDSDKVKTIIDYSDKIKDIIHERKWKLTDRIYIWRSGAYYYIYSDDEGRICIPKEYFSDRIK